MAKAFFRDILKFVARESIPPAALRGFKAARRRLRANKPFPVPGSRLVMTHRGTDEDVELFDTIILQGAYNFTRTSKNREIEALYASIDKPLILDLGANIGAASVWFAAKFPRTTVIAVEPELANFALLEKNMAGVKGRAVHGAIAAEPGELPIFDPGMGTAGFRTMTDGNEKPVGSVRAYTLDEIAAMAPDCTPFVVKIDIEGFERELFTKHAKILDDVPIVILELHDWFRTGSSQTFLDWHRSQDRDLEHTYDNVFSISNKHLPRVASNGAGRRA